MSAPQFTPEPWQWWDDGEGLVRITTVAEQKLVAKTVLPSTARLIAAAPRMYRQLEIFVSTIVNDDMLSLDLDLAREADEAAAILKEARGDQ